MQMDSIVLSDIYFPFVSLLKQCFYINPRFDNSTSTTFDSMTLLTVL